MEAGEGAGGVEGGAGDQGGPGCHGASSGPSAGPPGPSGAGGKGATAGGAPQAEGTLEVSGRDGATGACPEQLLEFTLAVHFLSFLEAEVALRSLLTAPFGGPDHRELRVDGSDLIVHLNAGDPGTLQNSITSFLNDLAEVVRTMEDIGPPFFNNSLLVKGA
ncbi:EKC/KEOPS complex subunit LAGE3-like [Dasypus novemcinctus]|uniref:EKC/KEOPS complex subunit LAGE3-like n=1 Tax=Dasypus novemcinctus TaxID=9361 RepID=UPI00266055AB|nr:cancer/testis antigen 1-like [Dasypus novemcinctus]